MARVAFPPDELTTARAIVARPGDFLDEQLRDACTYLLACGDWMDRSRASELQDRLDQDDLIWAAKGADDVPSRLAESVWWNFGMIIGLLLLLAMVLIGARWIGMGL